MLAAALLGGCGRGTPEQPAADAWHQLLGGAQAEGVTRQVALDAFATLIGPIPGGHAIDRRDEPVGTRSGTPAVRWLLPHWGSLDADQQKAVLALVYGAQDGPGDSSTVDVRKAVHGLIARVRAELTSRFGVTFPPKWGIRLSPFPRPNMPDTEATTGPGVETNGRWQPASRTDKIDGCLFTFYPLWTNEFTRVQQRPTPEVLDTVAHELFHCHQRGILGLDTFGSGPSWLIEGSAEWVGSRYAYDSGKQPAATSEWWKRYFEEDGDARPAVAGPPVPLFGRSFDAIGFYAHLEYSGRTPRQVLATIDTMIKLPSDRAFTAAVDATDAALLRRWATGYVRQSTMGPQWRTNGPGLGTYWPAPPHEKLLRDGGVDVTTTAPPAVAKSTVLVDPVVQAVRATMIGHGGLHWRNVDSTAEEFFDTAAEQTRWYCLALDGCSRCPVAVSRIGTKELTVAVTGGLGAGRVHLEVIPKDRPCGDPPVVQPPPQEVPPVCLAFAEKALRVLHETAHQGRGPTGDIRDGLTSCSQTLQPRPGTVVPGWVTLHIGVTGLAPVTCQTGSCVPACEPIDANTCHLAGAVNFVEVLRGNLRIHYNYLPSKGALPEDQVLPRVLALFDGIA